eukprot:12152065-Ditylum_brightwellii.AAC.1
MVMEWASAPLTDCPWLFKTDEQLCKEKYAYLQHKTPYDVLIKTLFMPPLEGEAKINTRIGQIMEANIGQSIWQDETLIKDST